MYIYIAVGNVGSLGTELLFVLLQDLVPKNKTLRSKVDIHMVLPQTDFTMIRNHATPQNTQP